jgi:2,5-diketo-D-gluconate reductase A
VHSPERSTDITVNADAVPRLRLNDGNSIPQIGFGVYQIPPQDTAEAAANALEIGYRHIDTAQMYRNESGVGKAIRGSGIPREHIFVTSKLNNGFHEPGEARKAFERTLSELDVEYVDLFLIHWPLPTRYGGDFVSTWRTLNEFADRGLARSVGVSNFHASHLDRLVDETGSVPVVNQIEVHPYLTNEATRAASYAMGIQIQAWSPIAQGAILHDATVRAIADKTGRTAAQVVLRWHIQRGDVVLAKSTKAERMQENLSIFDFALDEADVAAICALDKGEAGRTGPNPETFDKIPI